MHNLFDKLRVTGEHMDHIIEQCHAGFPGGCVLAWQAQNLMRGDNIWHFLLVGHVHCALIHYQRG